MTSAKIYDEQILKLKNAGVIIQDTEIAHKVLANVGYFRICQYLFSFFLEPSFNEIELETLYDTYEFDRKLRLLLLEYLEKIEISLRLKIAYQHSTSYGEFGYMNRNHFGSRHNNKALFANIKRQLASVSKNSPLRLYPENKIPLTVVIELFTFGSLSKFFSDMMKKDKKAIDKEYFGVGYLQLESWLICLTSLRNKCAHYSKLYHTALNKVPKSFKNITFESTLFDYLRLIEYFLQNQSQWLNFVNSLEILINEHSGSINLKHIGFPINWKAHMNQ